MVPLTLQDIMTSTLLITIMVTILTTPITLTAESIPNVEIMKEMEGQTQRIKKTNQKEKMMTKTNLHFKMNLYVINILWIHIFCKVQLLWMPIIVVLKNLIYKPTANLNFVEYLI